MPFYNFLKLNLLVLTSVFCMSVL